MTADFWSELPVLGSLEPQAAAEKLAELGDSQLADELRAAPKSAEFRRAGVWQWPFRTKPWQHTSHAFGYIAPMKVRTGLRNIQDVAAIDADVALKGTRIKIALDALRIEEYPGSGLHHVLFDFYAQNQIVPAPEHLHFNATYRVRQGERAGIRGYPIFLGLSTGDDGVSFRCFTVNVKNDNDQMLLSILDSDTFKAGLRLATVAQPAIGPLTDLAQNLTKGIAKRHQNVPVQDVCLGLDFGDSPTGARLRLGSYIAAQVPEREGKFNWNDWALELDSRAIVRKSDPAQIMPFNYFIFAISSYAGP